jgi:energy-coupling factor transporter ATP-binding protein EcfA2
VEIATGDNRDRPRRIGAGPLRAAELAEAAILADLAVMLIVVGWFLPFTALFVAAAVTPFAALTVRHRLRAVVMAGLSGAVVGFLIFGLGLATNVLAAAGCGFVVGMGLRRGWGRLATVAFGLAAGWVPLAALSLIGLAVLSGTRELILKQFESTWRGVRGILRTLGVPLVGQSGDAVVAWLVRHWWIAAPGAELILVVVAVLLTREMARPVIARLESAVRRPALTVPPRGRSSIPPGPIPARLEHVTVRYPGGWSNALSDISLAIPAGTMVAVVGPNGSGKSTLGRVLAGTVAAQGSVGRPGAPALGRRGGTAVVFQRPESQVLGVRVRDDVWWGLPPGHDVDVEALLHLVGLDGFEDRETATLSGGELQRLAIAAALARRPALFISDESTAMVDPAGRRQILGLLRRLAVRHGLSVVHVTHRMTDARDASVVVALSEGRVVAHGTPRDVFEQGLVAT